MNKAALDAPEKRISNNDVVKVDPRNILLQASDYPDSKNSKKRSEKNLKKEASKSSSLHQPPKGKKKTDLTTVVMTKLLANNLKIDQNKKGDLDIKSLQLQDQVVSMKKEAIDDPFAEELNNMKNEYLKKHTEDQVFEQQNEDGPANYSRTFTHRSKRRFLISCQSNHRIVWDLFLIVMSTFNCIIIPMDVAFDSNYQSNAGYFVLIYGFALIFLMDVIINFRTSFINKFGEEIFVPKEIAIQYIASINFMLDICSISMLHLIGQNTELKILQILKVNAMGRFTKILRNMSWREETKALVKILWYFFMFVLYIHVLACLWFYIISLKEKWIPPMDYVSYKDSVLFDREMSYQYLLVFYYMVTTFGGNEAGPIGPLECGYVVFCMMAAAIVNANLFGEMSFLVTVISKKQTDFQNKVDTANTAMKNIDLETKVQAEVRDYFIFTQSTLDQQQDLNKFLELISPSLKIKVQRCVFLKILKSNKVLAKVNDMNSLFSANNPATVASTVKVHETNDEEPAPGMAAKLSAKIKRPFCLKFIRSPKEKEEDNSNKDEFLHIFVSKLETVLSIPEEQVLKQDDETYDMYLIAKGEGEVSQRDEKKQEHPKIAKLAEGDHFGEISMIYKCRRTATVQSLNYNTMAKLTEEQFKTLISEYPEYLRLLKQYLQEYNDPKKRFLLKTIQQVSYCTKISDEALHDLIHQLKPRYYEKGTILLKPDDTYSSLYFIEDGCLEVYTTFEGNEFIIERLYRGSSLNARTFFMEDLMYVYVRCAKNTIVLDLEQNVIDHIKSTHQDFEKNLLSYQNNILKQKKTYPLDFMVAVPPELKIQNYFEQTEDQIKRQNLLKNVVFRRIIELRVLKRKPKLNDILRLMKMRDMTNPKVREEFKRKLLNLYDENSQKNEKMEDKNYDRLMGNFDRLNKVLTAQQAALDNLEKRVTTLQKRREEREGNDQKRSKARQRINSIMQRTKEETKKKVPEKISTLKEDLLEDRDQEEEKDKANDDAGEASFNDEMNKTWKIKQIDSLHMGSSEDDSRFAKLNKIAGKYRKDEKFGKFKSPFLASQSQESESEEGNKDDDNKDDQQNDVPHSSAEGNSDDST